LSYLQGRGLTDETIDRFGLGWSGEGRGALAADLGREGVTPGQLVEAGLMRRDEETGRVTDLFYNRVMFPIRDRRGRAISFGGRMMGDGQPKYVNGPETLLFSKRRSLYGLDLAREAVRGGATLLVVEGYMDVIALHQAGFAGAVAPLGTALTEEQLDALWRLSPQPVLCFDGDAAGARAAARVADLALPMITAERGLRLMTLAVGEDPDSLIRRQGAAAFQAALAAGRPLSDALYDMLRHPGGENTPELRAAFRIRLVEASQRIQDKALASEYRRMLLDRFFAESRSAPSQRLRDGQRFRDARRHIGRPDTLGGLRPALHPPPPRPTPSDDGTVRERTRILTAILLRHPGLWHDVGHAFDAVALPDGLRTLRDAMRDWAENSQTLDSEGMMDHLTRSGLAGVVESVLASAPVPLPECAGPGAMPAEAEAGWWHIFGFLNVEQLRQEVRQSQDLLAREMTAENLARHQALTEALLKVEKGETDGVELAA
jgi:DNA primase